jgi:hypothetical protein
MPRSGTTWLARLLATSPGTALPGREPMNPRGKQYALGGTLSGWAAVRDLSGKQQRALRAAYAGRNPWTFSRYGRRQWAAPLPRTRVIVKDPFAMLSIPIITRVTGAVPVLVYRHPAAALASYRRMGWQPDVDELRAIVRRRVDGSDAGWGATQPQDEATAMALFWRALHEMALDDLERMDDALVLSHEELAGGGEEAVGFLFRRLGLETADATFAELRREDVSGTRSPRGLHDFDRSPVAAAQAWRAQIPAAELEVIEELTGHVRRRLESGRLALPSG